MDIQEKFLDVARKTARDTKNRRINKESDQFKHMLDALERYGFGIECKQVGISFESVTLKWGYNNFSFLRSKEGFALQNDIRDIVNKSEQFDCAERSLNNGYFSSYGDRMHREEEMEALKQAVVEMEEGVPLIPLEKMIETLAQWVGNTAPYDIEQIASSMGRLDTPKYVDKVKFPKNG